MISLHHLLQLNVNADKICNDKIAIKIAIHKDKMDWIHYDTANFSQVACSCVKEICSKGIATMQEAKPKP